MMITGKTMNFGVIGNPIEHSLSPVMQNAAIRAAGIDACYIAMRVHKLAEAVAGLRALGFRGWNVTIPHKTAIMEFLDEIDEDARIIGAVNTVTNERGRLIGGNTDVSGCIDALRAAGFEPRGKDAVLLGAGGAARAVIWGLLKAGVKRIAIGVRNVSKAQPVAEHFRQYGEIKLLDWQDEIFADCLNATDILINTTPIGMMPKTDEMPPISWEQLMKKAFVYDIIYTPQKTRFLQEAEAHGHRILNGEAMLVGQGAEALRRWTGAEADREVMTKALRAALKC